MQGASKDGQGAGGRMARNSAVCAFYVKVTRVRASESLGAANPLRAPPTPGLPSAAEPCERLLTASSRALR